jgi:hypothetical protein
MAQAHGACLSHCVRKRYQRVTNHSFSESGYAQWRLGFCDVPFGLSFLFPHHRSHNIARTKILDRAFYRNCQQLDRVCHCVANVTVGLYSREPVLRLRICVQHAVVAERTNTQESQGGTVRTHLRIPGISDGANGWEVSTSTRPNRIFIALMVRETGVTLKVLTGTEPQAGRIDSTSDAIGKMRIACLEDTSSRCAINGGSTLPCQDFPRCHGPVKGPAENRNRKTTPFGIEGRLSLVHSCQIKDPGAL